MCTIINYYIKKNATRQVHAFLKNSAYTTVGRIIKPEIRKHSIRGISTTRPAQNLNKLIPIRTFFNWDERKPGFFEADTVAHCGIRTEGQYICTLTLTDVHSGWTENRALLNKAHRRVKEATNDIKQHANSQIERKKCVPRIARFFGAHGDRYVILRLEPLLFLLSTA